MNAMSKGLFAGIAGTAALNIVTYLDMAARGRPASELPAKAAGKMAEQAHVPLGSGEAAVNRTQGLGPLLGWSTGLGWGTVYGAVHGVARRFGVRLPWPVAAGGLALAAMAGSDGPLVAEGLTDPRSWGVSGWLSDVVPHAAYGVVTALAYEALEPA
jgi:hypothetical protein